MRRLSVLLPALALAAGGLTAGAPASAAPPAAVPGPAAPAAVEGELLVGYAPGASRADRERARGRAAAALADRVVRGSGRPAVDLVRLPQGASRDAAAAALRADPAVSYVEPNWVVTHQGRPGAVAPSATSGDPYFKDGSLWGMYGDASSPVNQYGSQAAEAWAANVTGSKQVYVGVIDEGIQFTHPDLTGQVWTNPFDPANGRDDDGNGLVDDVHGWDFANGDNTIYDGGNRGSLDDHGTHVSGTIGAKANNGQGVVGVNWNVTLISGKFLSRNGGTIANAVKAVDYFTDLKTRHGFRIVATNNSWGGGGFSQALLDAIKRANAKDILFVAAAGNGGSDGVGDNNDLTPSYPSNYDAANVLAVAAIDRTGALARFSNFGAREVHLGAPGVGVWSTTAKDRYDSYSGTSMATPHVTGAAALYASTHPTATAAAIKNALIVSAVPTPSLTGKTATGGRLNAHAALGR